MLIVGVWELKNWNNKRVEMNSPSCDVIGQKSEITIRGHKGQHFIRLEKDKEPAQLSRTQTKTKLK